MDIRALKIGQRRMQAPALDVDVTAQLKRVGVVGIQRKRPIQREL